MGVLYKVCYCLDGLCYSVIVSVFAVSLDLFFRTQYFVSFPASHLVFLSHACTHAHTPIYSHTNARMRAHMRTCMHTCTRYTHTCTHIHMQAHMSTHTYTDTHMHTLTLSHTHMQTCSCNSPLHIQIHTEPHS